MASDAYDLRRSVIYCVYVRNFGRRDLCGGYSLAEVGVDYIWLLPIHPGC